VLTALLGSLLKDEQGQLTMQAQTREGVIDLLVCDYRGGELRGYARFDKARLDELGPAHAARPVRRWLSGGDLRSSSTDQRFQGIVPLEGSCLAEACEAYFLQSEQVPTLIRSAVRRCHRLRRRRPAAAASARGEEGRERLHARLDHPQWEHIATMGGSVRRPKSCSIPR
jgi:molecular chaperone Hsp33